MNKQTAIDFVLRELAKGRRSQEIALMLSRQIGAPTDLVSKFVSQVVASQKPYSAAPQVRQKPSTAVKTPPLVPKVTVQAAAASSPAQTNTAPWKPGDIIAGLYEVKELLGHGAMGTVHRVYHRDWKIDLAVKTPNERTLQSAEGRERFQEREAYEWVQLGLHPNIASCFYVRTLDDGIPRIFIEYVGGGSLTQWLKQGRVSDLETALDIAIQICSGVEWAHKCGLIHRDIKPANVLMTVDGIPKVTDLGLVKPVGEIGNDGIGVRKGHGEVKVVVPQGATLLAGTPGYAAPEQWIADVSITSAVDVYAIGVILYQMLAPLVGLAQHASALPQIWGQLYAAELDKGRPSGCPLTDDAWAELAGLLRHCLARVPQDRFPDAAILMEALQSVYVTIVGKTYPRPMYDKLEFLADGLNNQAVSLLDLGHEEEAMSLWIRALEVEEDHAEATYNRGLRLWRSGQITDVEIIQRLKQVLVSRPDKWLPAYLLAQIHMERGDHQEALKILGGLQEVGFERPEIVTALAEVKERLPNSRRQIHDSVSFEAPIWDWHSPPGIIRSGCLSKNGRYALAGTEDGRVIFVEIATNHQHTVGAHESPVTWVCFNQDEHYALSGSLDRTLRLWEIATSRCLLTFKGHDGGVTSACFVIDGRCIASGSEDKTIRLWETKTGRCLHILTGHQMEVNSVCFSEKGPYVLSGSSDKTLKLWDLVNNRCLRTFKGHSAAVIAVCLSEGERYALSGSEDGTLRLWETETGCCLRVFEGGAVGLTSVALSRDGQYAFSGSGNGLLMLWEVNTGRCLWTVSGHTNRVNSVSFSGDGFYVLSGSTDQTLKLWQMGDETRPYQAPSSLLCKTESGDVGRVYLQEVNRARQLLAQGESAAAADCIRKARSQPGFDRGQEALAIWRDLYTKLPHKALREGWFEGAFEGHIGEILSVCLSRDGRYALSGSSDKMLKLWEVSSDRCLCTLEGHEAAVTSVAFSEDERYALSGSEDKTLRLWDLETGGCLRTFEGHQFSVTSACPSADGQIILSGSRSEELGTLKYFSQDKGLMLWQTSTGRSLRKFKGHQYQSVLSVRSVCLSRDGRYALSGSNGPSHSNLYLWDVASGRRLRTFTGHKSGVTSVCFSENNYCALSGSEDGTLKLWEVETGRCLRTFEGHTAMVTAVHLSTDGRFALSGSEDRTVKVWNVVTGWELHTFRGHTAEVTSVCFSRDGSHALSGGKDQVLRLWGLDWKLAGDQPPINWDDLRLYLKVFLTRHMPYAGILPVDRQPSRKEIRLALSRQGEPVWTDADFQDLLDTLGCAGYGQLSPEIVRQWLVEMQSSWQAAPVLQGLQYTSWGSIFGVVMIGLCLISSSAFFLLISSGTFFPVGRTLWVVTDPSLWAIVLGALAVVAAIYGVIIRIRLKQQSPRLVPQTAFGVLQKSESQSERIEKLVEEDEGDKVTPNFKVKLVSKLSLPIGAILASIFFAGVKSLLQQGVSPIAVMLPLISSYLPSILEMIWLVFLTNVIAILYEFSILPYLKRHNQEPFLLRGWRGAFRKKVGQPNSRASSGSGRKSGCTTLFILLFLAFWAEFMGWGLSLLVLPLGVMLMAWPGAFIIGYIWSLISALILKITNNLRRD